MNAMVIIDNKRIWTEVKKINLDDNQIESIEVQPDKNKKGWLYVTVDKIVEFKITRNDYRRILKSWTKEDAIDFAENGLLNNCQNSIDEIMAVEKLMIETEEEETSNEIVYDKVVQIITELI